MVIIIVSIIGIYILSNSNLEYFKCAYLLLTLIGGFLGLFGWILSSDSKNDNIYNKTLALFIYKLA